MGHGRNLRRGFVEDDTPELTENQVIGRVAELRGKGIVAVQIASMESNALESALAHLPPRFRGVLFLRRGIVAFSCGLAVLAMVRGLCGPFSLGRCRLCTKGLLVD